MFAIWRRFREWVGRVRLDRELDDEVGFHLEMLEEQFRARGLTEADAKAAARREFGGVAHAKERYRDGRGLPWLETTARDLRYALRGLRRSPGFAAAAVLSLALGIGANTAIFSLFHALMLRLLPVSRPAELVNLYQTGGWINGHSSYPLYLETAKRTDLFQGVIARTDVAKVRFRERPNARENFALREFVSGNYFEVLGVKPALGRLFTQADDRIPGGHPLAVLSYDCWRNRYGADPAVLGGTVLVDQKPLTVIGVAAPGFHGVQVERHTEVWVPIMMAEMPFKAVSYWWLQILARARPRIPRKQVQAAVNVLMQQHVAAAYPTSYNAASRQRAMAQRLEVRDAGIGLSMLREEFAKPLQVLMAAVGLVLLMTCTNVANLLLARGAARRKEIAMRFSLGAPRARLVRQALTESVLLAVAGAALGIGLGFWGARVILRFLPEQAGNPLSATPEPAVLAFTLAISVFSVLVFGLIPALRSTAVHPAAGLRPETGGGAAPMLRRVLVVAQVAFSVVLVVMAGLFGRSLFELRSVDLGFRNRNVLAFTLDLPQDWRNRDVRAPYRQLAEQMQSLPGVFSVTYGLPGPFLMGSSSASIRVPGSARTASEPADVETACVAPRYFETIGTPLLLGREFDRNDTAASPKVAVVNEAFVRAFLPGEAHPDGRFLSFDDSKPEGGERTSIIGVVRDIRDKAIQKPPKPTIYVPIDQNKVAYPPSMLVRTQLPPAALLPLIYQLGPSIAISDFGTIRQHIDDSIFEQRLLASLSGFFGVLALILAAVGLYGVVAYGTAGRTGEIGLRIALGARRGQVLGMILRDSLALVSVGLAIGLAASFAAARAVASILYGIQPSDPSAFVFTAVALALTGLAAAFLPARRAASIDPMRALRHE
jgi:predicted permease